MTKRLKISRAMVLGFIVLLASFCAAQTKTAIERMNDRVVEWQKAPTGRFVGFEVAFPPVQVDARPQHKSVLLLITIITKDPKKEYASNVFVMSGEVKMQLTSLGASKTQYGVDPSMTRLDNVYFVPIATANGDFECVVGLGWPATNIDLGRLPAWSPAVVVATNPSPDANSNLSSADSIKEAFPELTLQPVRVRISSGVAAAQLLKRAYPSYPKEAKKAHISGVVVLAVTISTVGKVENIRAISGPKELVDAAVDAVRQWEYKPYRLNGEPTEVETTITINFNLG